MPPEHSRAYGTRTAPHPHVENKPTAFLACFAATSLNEHPQQPSVEGRIISADGDFAAESEEEDEEREGEGQEHNNRHTRGRLLGGEGEREGTEAGDGDGERAGGNDGREDGEADEVYETSVHMRMVSTPKHDNW